MIFEYRERCVSGNGMNFCKDLKIIEDRIVENWWREERHRVDTGDVADILVSRKSPGSCCRHGIRGFYGSLKVPSFRA